MPSQPTPTQRRQLSELFLSKWWVKALLATEHDILGAILRSAMGILPKAEPLVVFGPKCVLLDDLAPECSALPFAKDGSGVVWCNVLEVGALEAVTKPICTVKDMVGAVRNLVDDLEFNIDEVTALLRLITAWIGNDNRSQAMSVEDRVPGVH